jgi:hypothetical protein
MPVFTGMTNSASLYGHHLFTTRGKTHPKLSLRPYQHKLNRFDAKHGVFALSELSGSHGKRTLKVVQVVI